jgi:3-oxoadipate enol-lactonase
MASTTGALNFSLIDHPEIKNLHLWDARSNEIGKQLAQRGILRSIGARLAAENPSLSYLYRQIYEQTPAEYREAVRRRVREQRVLSPAAVSQLDVPVLFLTGGEDLIFPPGAAAAAASIMPSARYCCVPEAGHSLYFERAHVFNTLVDEFLASL